MDLLIVSNNEKILHISNEEDKIDYTVYDSFCQLIDGGVIDLDEPLNKENAVQCVVEMLPEQIEFSKPIMSLPEELVDDLLELIQESDYQNMLQKIKTSSCYKEEQELEMID